MTTKKFTRVRYSNLDDETATLLWDFICLPPTEKSSMDSAIVYEVPPAMISTQTQPNERFTLVSDPYARSSKLVSISRLSESVYELTQPTNSFKEITLSKEFLDVDKYRLYPGSKFSGVYILTMREEAQQVGWGHVLQFYKYRKYQYPCLDTLNDLSDYFFTGHTNEIEMTVAGFIDDEVVLKCVLANLPRCFGYLHATETG